MLDGYLGEWFGLKFLALGGGSRVAGYRRAEEGAELPISFVEWRLSGGDSGITAVEVPDKIRGDIDGQTACRTDKGLQTSKKILNGRNCRQRLDSSQTWIACWPIGNDTANLNPGNWRIGSRRRKRFLPVCEVSAGTWRDCQ